MTSLAEMAAAPTSPQYGTGLHYPACLGSCTGCLPPLPPLPATGALDLSLFRPVPTSPIVTRPQDWAAPARAILDQRGAWGA